MRYSIRETVKERKLIYSEFVQRELLQLKIIVTEIVNSYICFH